MPADRKYDLKKDRADYRARSGRFDVLTVPPTRYLMVDGHGDPNTDPSYAAALAALYPVAYALKFASKSGRTAGRTGGTGRDYVVPPLEGLWWAEDMATFTSGRDKSAWDWTMMIAMPDWLGEQDATTAVDAVRASAVEKQRDAPARLGDVRVDVLDEGLCVQTLHIGLYDGEGPVLEWMHNEVIPSHGLEMTGTHHEIYLGDPRRAAPEKLRTILRQPVRPAG
ncbi:MAG TPA: GyrI-like domain-containing protein [Candidatus Corynebacterium avicola]|uniref:GyrI-like domain-containing protein n=1 Tax=Candidatus Corynebacterium avicola TaxID=2838527 RepID=A0A9D1ULE1_9CORY|nr:GyrI-like domain-containing protein [Candidatus Corynebacterium avicola]